MRPFFHRGVELDLEAEGIGELQRAALERWLGEFVLNAVLGEEAGRLVEVVLVADLEAKMMAGRGLRPAQHQRVMLVLLAATQVNDAIVRVLDMQADGVLVERTAGLQVLHVEHDMTRSDDVEGRIEDVCWNGQSLPPYVISSFRDTRRDQARNPYPPVRLAL